MGSAMAGAVEPATATVWVAAAAPEPAHSCVLPSTLYAWTSFLLDIASQRSNFSQVRKRYSGLKKQTTNVDGEALDALNVGMRRKATARQRIELNIEATGERRRSHEAPVSSTWKRPV